MKPAALLLDVDRTLVDLQSFTDYSAANDDVAGEIGDVAISAVPETDWGSVTQRAMATLVSLSDRPDLWQRASVLIEAHEVAAIDRAEAMPGLAEFLAATSSLPRALATLMGQDAVDKIAERFAIDVAVRIGRRASLRPKPAPDQLIAACREIGVAAGAAVFVGDSSWDEAAAAAAGVRFIGVTNGAPSQFEPRTPVATNLLEVLALLG